MHDSIIYSICDDRVTWLVYIGAMTGCKFPWHNLVAVRLVSVTLFLVILSHEVSLHCGAYPLHCERVPHSDSMCTNFAVCIFHEFPLPEDFWDSRSPCMHEDFCRWLLLCTRC